MCRPINTECGQLTVLCWQDALNRLRWTGDLAALLSPSVPFSAQINLPGSPSEESAYSTALLFCIRVLHSLPKDIFHIGKRWAYMCNSAPTFKKTSQQIPITVATTVEDHLCWLRKFIRMPNGRPSKSCMVRCILATELLHLFPKSNSSTFKAFSRLSSKILLW